MLENNSLKKNNFSPSKMLTAINKEDIPKNSNRATIEVIEEKII